MSKLKKLPGTLSFQRGTVVSDALMYNWSENSKPTPLQVLYHGIRGTQNVVKEEKAGSAVGNARAREVSNVQHTESAKLSSGASHLLVEFSIRFLDLKHSLFSCAPGKKDDMNEINQFKNSLSAFIEQAKSSEGLAEVSRRYARNIANARWLWRNRMAGESVEVEVSGEGFDALTFDALSIPLNHFDEPSKQELELAALIQQGMTGNSTAALKVRAKVDFGMSDVEVFPSQNYLEEKPKGFSRSLYKIGNTAMDYKARDNQTLGQAALRDQKIGNAIRTIDTWYADYPERGLPIPVEPNGASLEAQQFFRSKPDSAFTIIKRIDDLDPNSPEGMFMIACLVRGGVYSEGENS